MHSDIPENLIQQALEIHKENTRLVRLAAPPADTNFCDQWFQLQTHPEFTSLFARLNLQTGRNFTRWWADIFDEYVNTKRILEIKNIFEMPIVGTETLYDFGADRNYGTYPFEPAKAPHGIDGPIWNKINDNLTILCQYLYVYLYRNAMTGDRNRYDRFLSRYPAPSSTSSSGRSESISTDQMIENLIPKRLLDSYSVTPSNSSPVDSYTYVKKEVTKFFVKCFPFDNKGKAAKYQFLKTLSINNFIFDDYWASLPGFYSGISEINDAIFADVPISGSAPMKLFDLGTGSGTNQVDKDEIKKALDNLINNIREHEVNELINSWSKVYGTVGKIFYPFFKTYEVTQNLMGAAGSLGIEGRYRR